MNMMSNSLYASKIELVSSLFLQTFYRKILMFLIIMLDYYLQLSILIISWYLRVLDIYLSAIPCWSDVSRMGINLNQLGDLLCNLSIWMNEDIIHPVWSLV